MIVWLQPAALWGLVLSALPVLVHLLRRRQADRVAFPSLRFVAGSQAAAVRLRPPSGINRAVDLVSKREVSFDRPVRVGPMSTMVLHVPPAQ